MSQHVEGPAPPGNRPEVQAATKPLKDASIIPRADDTVPQQLRRRREASLRLSPLDSGVRDPIDVLVSYSSEPLRLFWYELRDRGLLSDAITAELVRLARGPPDGARRL